MTLPNPPMDEKFAAIAASNVQLANGCMALAQSNNRVTKMLEKVAGELHQTREALASVIEHREADNEKLFNNLAAINTALALNVDNIRHVDQSVREVTGKHILMDEDEIKGDRRRGTIVQVLEAFSKMPRSAQILLIILILAVATGGWLSRILAGQ